MDSYSAHPTRRLETPSRDSPLPVRQETPVRKFNRRKSVVDRFEFVREGLQRLTLLWDEVYMSEDSRAQRMDTALGHIETLVEDMIDSETKMVETAKQDILNGQEEILNKRRQLKLDDWVCDQPFPSIALLKAVEKELRSVRALYKKKEEEQLHLLERFEVLCFRLGKHAVEHLPETKRILDEAELKDLQANVTTMETEARKRQEVALEQQKDLRRWNRILGDLASSQLVEPELTVILESDIDSDDFALTDFVLEQIQQYWDQMCKMFNDWLAEMDMRWTELYHRLSELWDLCHVTERDRNIQETFDPDIHTEKDVAQMSLDIAQLEARFETRRELYSLVEKFKNIWKTKMSMVERKKDPNYYQSRDRHHNLMSDLKQERQLNDIAIPNIEKDIASAYKDHIRQHPDDIVMIEGIELSKYVNWVKEEFRLSQDHERELKLKMKKNDQQNQRTPMRTPRKTPARPGDHGGKQRRVDVNMGTIAPAFCNQSEMPSMITPTHRAECGPKTSSPKHGGSSNRPMTSTPLRNRNDRQ